MNIDYTRPHINIYLQQCLKSTTPTAVGMTRKFHNKDQLKTETNVWLQYADYISNMCIEF